MYFNLQTSFSWNNFIKIVSWEPLDQSYTHFNILRKLTAFALIMIIVIVLLVFVVEQAKQVETWKNVNNFFQTMYLWKSNNFEFIIIPAIAINWNTVWCFNFGQIEHMVL